MIEFTVNTANDKWEAERLNDFTYFSTYKFRDLHRVASTFYKRNNLKNLTSEKFTADPSAGILTFKHIRLCCEGCKDYKIDMTPNNLHNVVRGSLRYLTIFLSKIVTRDNDCIVEMLQELPHEDDALAIDLVQRSDARGVYYSVLTDRKLYHVYSMGRHHFVQQVKSGICKFDTEGDEDKVVLW